MSGGHSPEMVQACLGGGPGLKIQGENTTYGGENQHRVREELTGRKTLGRSVLPRSQGEVARVYMCVCVREREREMVLLTTVSTGMWLA